MPPLLTVIHAPDRWIKAPSRSWWRWLKRGSFGVALIGLAIVAWNASSAETRALRALPREERLAIYQHAIENLQTVCDPAPARSMRDFCREQASLASKFRECDAAATCRALVRRHLFQPRR